MPERSRPTKKTPMFYTRLKSRILSTVHFNLITFHGCRGSRRRGGRGGGCRRRGGRGRSFGCRTCLANANRMGDTGGSERTGRDFAISNLGDECWRDNDAPMLQMTASGSYMSWLRFTNITQITSTPTNIYCPARGNSPGKLHGAMAPFTPQTGALLAMFVGQQPARPPSRWTQSPESHQHLGSPSMRQVSAQQFMLFAL